MGLLILLAVLFVGVALVASQFPHWLTAVAFTGNIAVYVLVWGGLPERWTELGHQAFHITVLIGGQLAAILGLLAPLVRPALAGRPRWLRALGAAIVTLPVWLVVPVLLY